MRRELIAAIREAHAVHDALHRILRTWHLVDAGNKLQVLQHREIFIEAELLRHVTDFTANPQRFSENIEAKAGAMATIGGEKAAEHANSGRLSTAVGPEKAADLALANAKV